MGPRLASAGRAAYEKAEREAEEEAKREAEEQSAFQHCTNRHLHCFLCSHATCK